MRFLIHQTRDYPKTVKQMTGNDLFQHLTELVFIRLQSPCSLASVLLSFFLRGHLRLTLSDRQKQHWSCYEEALRRPPPHDLKQDYVFT